MECFKLLLEHLVWIEHQLLSCIKDSRKAGSLRGMMRGVGGVRQFRKRFCWKRLALFKSGQWHFQQDKAPVHNSILVTDYLTKMGIKTVRHPPYSSDLAPCDFWLSPKLRGCHYETIEEMKEAVKEGDWHAHTRGLPWGLPEVVGMIQVHCSWRRLLQRRLEFHVCTVNKIAHTKKVWKLI